MAKGTVTPNGSSKANGKVNFETFVTKAIVALRTDKSKGIHTVYSGLASAAREYFGKARDADFTKDWFWTSLDALAEAGKIETTVAKGGKMVYLPGEAPARKTDNRKVIAAILA